MVDVLTPRPQGATTSIIFLLKMLLSNPGKKGKQNIKNETFIQQICRKNRHTEFARKIHIQNHFCVNF